MVTEHNEILFERVDEHVALVRLNRPAARHAINGALARALEAAVDTVERDSSLRVAILASADGTPTFCAGADLGEVVAGRGRELVTAGGGFAGFVKKPRTKPWIAAVRGTAVGGGFELVLACDMIVAGASAKFGLPEVKRGLLAGAGGAFRVARSLPRAIAIELATTGRSLDVQRALHFGLVNYAVPDEQVIAEAVRLARDIASSAPLSVSASLTLARAASDHKESELWTLTTELAKHIVRSEDAKEGPRAFLEKRTPNWKGC